MSKLREKIFASMLVVPMVLSNIYLPVLGVEEGDITNENTEVSDSSKIATVSGKEENVYVNLNDDGSVDNVYVVNEILLAEFGKVTDFGNYSEVRNLSNSGEITNSENTINFDGTLGKNYYQGTLASKEIPWNISIKYFTHCV